MKNGLLYYYSLNVDNIHQNGSEYKFSVDNINYILVNTLQPDKEINQLYMLINDVKSKYHQIILNNQKNIITTIDNNNYILLKYNKKKDIVFLNDIIVNSVKVDKNKYKFLNRTNWIDLWSEKIDYFEYQIEQFSDKYPLLKESFPYYAGITENAIQYASMINDKNITVSHKRIYNEMNIIDYFNPINLIVDYEIRDVAEYFKTKFMYSYLSIEEVTYYIDYYLDNDQLITFFTRMLFPSYYFDIYENILNGKAKEKELLKVIRKTNDYEKFLKILHKHLSVKINIILPEWI